MKAISIIIILSSCFLTYAHAQKWEIKRETPLPEPVTNNAVAEGFIQDVPFVYSFGGLDSTKKYSGIHRRSYRYNTSVKAWEGIPPLPDTLGKIAAAASRVRDHIYIIGGYHVFEDGHELSSDKVHRYSIPENRFIEDGTPVPFQIDDHVQAVWRDSLIYVITGWSDTENKPYVQIYNPFADQWHQGTPVPDNNNFKSFGASGVIMGDTIFYFGGAAYDKYYPIQSVLRMGIINPVNPFKVSWSIVSTQEIFEGYRMAAVKSRDKIFWIGGSETTYNYNGISYKGKKAVSPSERILEYNPTTNVWKRHNYENIPMDLRGAGELNDQVKYLVGGMSDNQVVSDKVIRFEITDK